MKLQIILPVQNLVTPHPYIRNKIRKFDIKTHCLSITRAKTLKKCMMKNSYLTPKINVKEVANLKNMQK
jgi:hypothetical protein